MSSNDQSNQGGEDPLLIAKRAEQDLNSHSAKVGHAGSDSTTESGVDAAATKHFPGASVTYGSAASGAGDNREIPVEEGGDVSKESGRATKAKDFEGPGGPEDKAEERLRNNPGDDEVRVNVR